VRRDAYCASYRLVRRLTLLEEHQAALRGCRRCDGMVAPPVVGAPVRSKILLIGQAPGDKEPVLGRPFAWTAGKQLFKWFATLGVDEAEFRKSVYMAATCRCFPGKNPRGGDRVPSDMEVAECRPWLERELELLQPTLLIPIGRLAIQQFLPAAQLVEQVGKSFQIARGRRNIDVIPLPHPSGASTWPRSEPGKSLTARALRLLGAHAAWRATFG
jgi:uracil-DNA glycosylase